MSQGLLWHGARFSVAPKSVSWQVSYTQALQFIILIIISSQKFQPGKYFYDRSRNTKGHISESCKTYITQIACLIL